MQGAETKEEDGNAANSNVIGSSDCSLPFIKGY